MQGSLPPRIFEIVVTSQRLPPRIRASSSNDYERESDVNPYEKLEMETERQRRLEDQQLPENSNMDVAISFDSLKSSVDTFLIADFFFVLASLAWLAAGIAGKFIFKTESIYLAWYALWPVVFQPALGMLMLGALVSGLSGWIKDQEGSDE